MQDEWEAWRKAMIAKGHSPILDPWGDLDIFVVSEDFHNGPGCSKCGWKCCYHCTPIDEIPECMAGD